MAGPGNPKGTNRGGGIPKGGKKRATLQRELDEALAQLAEVGRQREAAEAVAAAQKGQKQPKDVMLDAMQYWFGLAAKYQPTEENPDADEAKFRKYLREATDIAAKVAPYVHQKLQALQITPLPVDLSVFSVEELIEWERLTAKATLPGGPPGRNLPPTIDATAG